MYYEKKTLFLEFRKLRNWRRWLVAAGQLVAGGQMVARGVVAGGHSEKIKNFIKKALDNNILLVRGYKTPELYCQHDTIGTFYHFPSLQYVS